MAKRLNKTDRSKYDRLMRMFKKDPDEYRLQLENFAEAMDDKYGEPMSEIRGFSKGGMGMKKKGYAAGGLKAPGAGNTGLKKLPTEVRNKMGYMNKGGMPMKKKGMAKGGANMKKKAYAKGGKVAMYNVGGMVKSSSEINTGIARPKNTYK